MSLDVLRKTLNVQIGKIRYKGLKLYIRKGDSSKLPAQQLPKIAQILDFMEAAISADDLPRAQPGQKRQQRVVVVILSKVTTKAF